MRPDELHADLVVNASGRDSRAVEWLVRLGYPSPPETRVNSFLGYASRCYRRPRDWQSEWKTLVVSATPPHSSRGAVLVPIEGERWLVTLAGAKLPRFLEGLLTLGDAACAFNPVYGQGMTIAALGARALDQCLREQRRLYPTGEVTGLAERFQKKLGRVITTSWLLATGEDFRYPTTVGAQPSLATRILRPYLDQVLLAAAEIPSAHQVFVQVVHLVKPPTALFDIRVFAPVLAHMVRQKWRRTDDRADHA